MNFELVSGRYKSFEAPFEWKDIPRFVMLTGPNGAGKTQLLEMLHRAATNPKAMQPATANISGEEIGRQEVLFLPEGWSFSNPNPVNQGTVSKAVDQLVQQLKRNTGNPQLNYLRRQLTADAGKPAKQLSKEEILERLPIDALLSRQINPAVLPAELAQIFHRYHLRRASLILRDRNIADQEVEQQLGRAPWDVVNELLGATGLKHRIAPPADDALDASYELKMIGPAGNPVAVEDLSSGEKTLLGLALMLYNSRENGIIPKLVLLDEPDAHLHPAMIRGFFQAIRTVLVREFSCRIIATTHRPDTIVLTPEDKLYEVYPQGKRVRAVTKKSDAIARLSANFIAVLPNTRCVLVEDEDDAEFFNTVLSILIADYEADFRPMPVFQPASTGKGKQKIPGGKTVVRTWVKRLGSSGLAPLVHGIIDRDASNPGGPNIHVLKRYSIESYLCDPIVVFASLTDAGAAPTIPELAFSPGDEWKIRELEPAMLQRIADVILQPIKERLTKPARGKTRVSYLTGQTLKVPKWLVKTRGHDLAYAFYEEYGDSASQRLLMHAFTRLRLIPVELRELFNAIRTQGSTHV